MFGPDFLIDSTYVHDLSKLLRSKMFAQRVCLDVGGILLGRILKDSLLGQRILHIKITSFVVSINCFCKLHQGTG